MVGASDDVKQTWRHQLCLSEEVRTMVKLWTTIAVWAFLAASVVAIKRVRVVGVVYGDMKRACAELFVMSIWRIMLN